MWPPLCIRESLVILGLLVRPKRRVNLGDGILLHARQDVAVEVERYPDLGMPEPFCGSLHMGARGKHVRGVGVPEVVRP